MNKESHINRKIFNFAQADKSVVKNIINVSP